MASLAAETTDERASSSYQMPGNVQPLVIATVFAFAVGCRRPAMGRTAEQRCSAVSESLPLTATSAGMAGHYRLVLVATRGPYAGSIASGRLALWRPDTSSHFEYEAAGGIDIDRAMELFHGVTDVPLERVGALRDGDPESADPFHPGVLVKEFNFGTTDSSTGRENLFKRIQLTIGSVGNRRDVIEMDSMPPELQARRVDVVGFAGDWESVRAGVLTGGHFCAFRE